MRQTCAYSYLHSCPLSSLQVLEKERKASTSTCWYSDILQTVFTSPYNEKFLPIKPTLLSVLASGISFYVHRPSLSIKAVDGAFINWFFSGGLDAECTQQNIYHTSFNVNYFKPFFVIKCTFGKNGYTKCEDISKEENIPKTLNSSVMIIKTPTRKLAPLAITKIYLTTVIAPVQYFGTFLAEDEQV